MNYKIKTFLVAVFATTIIAGIRYVDWKNQQLVIQRDAELSLVAISTSIQQKLDEDILLTDALSALVMYNDLPTQEEFDKFTAFFAEHNKEILSLQLAPDGIVKYVTDPLRNRAAIGHNLLTGEASRESALRAIKTGEKIAVGPVNLIQGGRALIVRNPIYKDDGEFWGFSTVLIDFDTMVKESLSFDQLSYVDILSLNEDGSGGKSIFGTKGTTEILASGSITFGSNKWQIHITENFRTYMPFSFVLSNWFWVLSVVICVTIVTLSYKVFRTRDELQRAVDESTASLSATLLHLEQENEKRNQLYGMIAHELRTPVSSINMIAYDSDLNWTEHRNDIQQHSDILLDTLNDMRMLINPNIERENRIAPFKLRELVDYVTKANNSIVTSTNFTMTSTLKVDSSLKDQIFTSDIYRIRTAISNLIRNACLHSEGSTISLSYRVATVKNKHSLIVDVTDNGKGIPPQKHSTIFDPGVRGDSSSPGTGVGLTIARNWIREINGELDLHESTPGRGCSFRLSVPLSITDKTALNDEDLSVGKRVAQRLNVLMVEDDRTLRMLGEKLLVSRVNKVMSANDPLEAFEIMPHEKFDMIITDYYMPEMNGDVFIRKLRESGFTGTIVGLTAATIGSQVDDMYAAGADSVMFKPISVQSFYKTVEKLY